MIFENEWVTIEVEPSSIPWLKIFAKQPAKEFTDCDKATRKEIWRMLEVIETQMRAYFQPDKINIASFANYVPQVHWHIMARYSNDSHFPEPMWGPQQRPSMDLGFPPMAGFVAQLQSKLNSDK